MSKREKLEDYLYEIYRLDPTDTNVFVVGDWADNLLHILGLEIQTTETIKVK